MGKERIRQFNYDFTKPDWENRKVKNKIKKEREERRLYRDKSKSWCKKGQGIQLNIFKKKEGEKYEGKRSGKSS